MNKKYLIISLIAIGITVLLYFLLQPDKPHDTHNRDRAEAIAIHDTLQIHDAISEKIIDSLKRREDSLIKDNARLREGQSVTRRQLDLRTAEVRTLAKEIQEQNKDTALQGRIDELVLQVDNLTFLLGQYEQYADSINRVTDSLVTTCAAKDAEREKNKAELKAAYQKLYTDYLELYDTNKGLRKSLKWQKLKTKIAVLFGLIGGAAAVLK